MKRYTNKILIITAIVVVLGFIVGYTIDFQTGYRSGRIKYEKFEEDYLDDFDLIDSVDGDDTETTVVETSHEKSQQENETISNKESEKSNQ